MRAADDTPWVTLPDGELVKSGKRKGEPKRIAYGSPSGYGALIENLTGLYKWEQRGVIRGIGVDPNLRARTVAYAEAVRAFEDHFDTSDEDAATARGRELRSIADGIVVDAKLASRLMLAADRGTHAHTLSEYADEGLDWENLVDHGETLGLSAKMQAQIVEAWTQMLERNHLEVLAKEAAIVDDEWHVAGTLDRIVRCKVTLRFAREDGTITDVPAGTILVLDIKTGATRLKHSIQVAAYAKGLPYDVEKEVRSEWPWKVSQEHALIAHLSMADLLDGTPSCTLVHIDLPLARKKGGSVVVAAKEWAKQYAALYSVAQLDPEERVSSGEAEDRKDSDGASGFVSSSPDEDVPPPEVVTLPPGARVYKHGEEPSLVEQVAEAAKTGGKKAAKSVLDAATSGREPYESDGAANLSPKMQQAVLRSRTPDEGDPAHGGDWTTMQTAYKALTKEARTWIADITTESIQGQVSFHGLNNQTTRRYHIIRTLVAIAEPPQIPESDVREMLAAIIGDSAHLPDAKLGHIIGTLDAHEATQWASLVVDGNLALTFTSEGKAELAEPVHTQTKTRGSRKRK